MRPFITSVSGLSSVVSVDPDTSWAVKSIQEAINLSQLDVSYSVLLRCVIFTLKQKSLCRLTLHKYLLKSHSGEVSFVELLVSESSEKGSFTLKF